MYPQVGHPIRCYLSADPTSFQVTLQLLDIGCGGVLDLKPLLGRWNEMYREPTRTDDQRLPQCPILSSDLRCQPT